MAEKVRIDTSKRFTADAAHLPHTCAPIGSAGTLGGMASPTLDPSEIPAVTIYEEVTVLLMATALIGLLALSLRQPLIVAYIQIGIVAGPSVLDWVGARSV